MAHVAKLGVHDAGLIEEADAANPVVAKCCTGQLVEGWLEKPERVPPVITAYLVKKKQKGETSTLRDVVRCDVDPENCEIHPEQPRLKFECEKVCTSRSASCTASTAASALADEPCITCTV
jgi:hypothetical protein